MADTTLKSRGYRAVPRQGMRKWAVVHDVEGVAVTVADFHSYPAAMAEIGRLNAAAPAETAAPTDAREKILA